MFLSLNSNQATQQSLSMSFLCLLRLEKGYINIKYIYVENIGKTRTKISKALRCLNLALNNEQARYRSLQCVVCRLGERYRFIFIENICPVHIRFLEVDLIFQQVNRFQFNRNITNLNILLLYIKSTTQRLTSSIKVDPQFLQIDLLASVNRAVYNLNRIKFTIKDIRRG